MAIKNIIKSVFVILGFTVILKIIGFVMRVILSRTLGASALGVYQIALSFFGVICTVVASGIPVTISHISAKCGVNNDYRKEGMYVSSGLIISVLCSLILSILVLLFKPLIIKTSNEISFNVLFILIPAIFATAIYGCFRGALWGREKHIANCLAELGEQGIRMILFIILLSNVTNTTKATYLAGLSLCISCFISMFISIIYYKKYGGKLYNPKNEFRNFLKTSGTITLTRVVTSCLQPIISIILPLRLVKAGYSQDLAMSMFGIAMGMTFPLLALPNTICGSFATAIIPEISSLVEKKNYEEFNNKIRLAITITLFTCFCFVPLFLGLGQPLGILLFNDATSGYLLTISAWTMIPAGLSMITNSILNILNMERHGFISYLISSIFILACIWFLPKYCGITSVIVGMGGSFAISSVFNLYFIIKKTKVENIIFRPLVLMIIFSIATSLLGSHLYGIFKYLMPNFFNLCLTDSISCGLFALLCLLFNIIDLKSLLKDFNIVKSLKIRRKKKKI